MTGALSQGWRWRRVRHCHSRDSDRAATTCELKKEESGGVPSTGGQQDAVTYAGSGCGGPGVILTRVVTVPPPLKRRQTTAAEAGFGQ